MSFVTTYHRNCQLFVMDRDEHGASIDRFIEIPVTVWESSNPDERTRDFEAHINPADVDRLIKSLTTILLTLQDKNDDSRPTDIDEVELEAG